MVLSVFLRGTGRIEVVGETPQRRGDLSWVLKGRIDRI